MCINLGRYPLLYIIFCFFILFLCIWIFCGFSQFSMSGCEFPMPSNAFLTLPGGGRTLSCLCAEQSWAMCLCFYECFGVYVWTSSVSSMEYEILCDHTRKKHSNTNLCFVSAWELPTGLSIVKANFFFVVLYMLIYNFERNLKKIFSPHV